MTEMKKLLRTIQLIEEEHKKQYNIMLDQRILSMFKMWNIKQEKP